jgi:ubiquinone/menaquinone biosynthesis C-methylase UbiE
VNSADTTNPFADAEVGQLYDRGRPYLQARAVRRIAQIVGVTTVRRALDVACGTGLSSVALAHLGDNVVGSEIASGMLAAARRHPTVHYILSPAERLPFPGSAFDAVTVASGVHWFNQERFFAETHRVLTVDGWLAIYDHFFLGEMENVPGFSSWMEDSFSARYPLPPRSDTAATTEAPPRFHRVGGDEYVDVVEMTHRGLVDYLLTQSNTTVAVASESESRAEVRAWLSENTERFFDEPDHSRRLRFWTVIVCFSASDPES